MRAWLEAALNGSTRVGLPWQSLWAFLRIVTNPRAMREPLHSAEAWEIVDARLGAPPAWIPAPTARHRHILGRLLTTLDLRGKLVGDVVLAAICIEHGLTIVSADSDFARFPELKCLNPTA